MKGGSGEQAHAACAETTPCCRGTVTGDYVPLTPAAIQLASDEVPKFFILMQYYCQYRINEVKPSYLTRELMPVTCEVLAWEPQVGEATSQLSATHSGTVTGDLNVIKSIRPPLWVRPLIARVIPMPRLPPVLEILVQELREEKVPLILIIMTADHSYRYVKSIRKTRFYAGKRKRKAGRPADQVV